MNFRRQRQREEPEINFIPLIDLLLVILIFLMVTTTYSQFAELQINLPGAASAEQSPTESREIAVAVAADNSVRVQGASAVVSGPALVAALRTASAKLKDPVVVVHADARATHEAVVRVMEAAREAGLTQLTFATRVDTP